MSDASSLSGPSTLPRRRLSADPPEERAGAHRPPLSAALPALALSGILASLLGASCGDQEAAAKTISPESCRIMVDRLIEISRPLDPTLTSDYHDRRLHQERALIAELRQAPPEVGQLALKTFQEKEKNPTEVPDAVRRNLLIVAAHSAPVETTPLLEAMAMKYGHKMEMRAEAAMLLGEVAPTRAVELLGPELLKKKATSTMPDDEFLLKGFIRGCENSGENPVPVLVSVATNIFKQDAARHRATEELGNHSDPLAQKALRAILVESTGNAYLRRKAAQAIRKSYPREEACAIFELVSQSEADHFFLEFLADMIQENCE